MAGVWVYSEVQFRPNPIAVIIFGFFPKTTLSGHSDDVNSVAFSPDGKSLASASNDNTIKIWNVATGKLNYTLTKHSDDVNSVAFSPDGKSLASGSNDNTIK
ncbi:MAG TPA: hypothetical protein V6D12_04215, partial [Candidatus Obscuribacterales bacterium]